MRDYSKPLTSDRMLQFEAIEREFPEALTAARAFTDWFESSKYVNAHADIYVNEPYPHVDVNEYVDYWWNILFGSYSQKYAANLFVRRSFEGAIRAELQFGLWGSSPIITVQLGTLRLEDMQKLTDMGPRDKVVSEIIARAEEINNGQ